MSNLHGKIPEYAAQLRAALGLDEPYYAGESLPAFSRYQRNTNRWSWARIPKSRGGGQKRGLSPKKKAQEAGRRSKRIRGMDPDDEILPPALFAELDTLPDEIIFHILGEAIFPHGLLHLNQLEGRKEERSRLIFELRLSTTFGEYLRAFTEISTVSSRFLGILQTTSMRTELYRKYMATPPEGLYEQPDVDNAIHPNEFRGRVKLSPHWSESEDNRSLDSQWYGDFLTTVVYNEWQRALSLSTARAVQLFYWAHRKTLKSETWSDFLDYWEIRSANEQARVKRALTITPSTGNLTPNHTVFAKKDFPLTWELDSFLLFGTRVPPLSRYLHRMLYQSFSKRTVAFPYENDMSDFNHGSTPVTIDLSRIFDWGQIELVRILRFHNVPYLKKIRDRPQWVLYQHSIPQQGSEIVIVDLRREDEMTRPSAVVVDRSYDVSTDEDHPGDYNPGGGFAPWNAGAISLILKNFRVDRITGMHEAVAQFKTGTTHPDPNARKVLKNPLINIEIRHSERSVFHWQPGLYEDPRDEQTGPKPLPSSKNV